jgi:hypothetical protein
LHHERTYTEIEITAECADTADGALDSWDNDCDYYIDEPGECGTADDDDFTAADMCCACGGGVTPEAPEPPEECTTIWTGSLSPDPEPFPMPCDECDPGLSWSVDSTVETDCPTSYDEEYISTIFFGVDLDEEILLTLHGDDWSAFWGVATDYESRVEGRSVIVDTENAHGWEPHEFEPGLFSSASGPGTQHIVLEWTESCEIE